MSAAELAFVNGSVYTVDAARTRASAVAVEDGRIVSVGSDDDVRDRIDATTEVLDLHGRMLVPGFQDAHVHPVSGGVDRLQCDLHDLHSADDYVEVVRSYADAHPEREWILGGGWSMDVFPGGTPVEGPPRRGRARPHRVPAEPRRPQRVGEHAARSRWPA